MDTLTLTAPDQVGLSAAVGSPGTELEFAL